MVELSQRGPGETWIARAGAEGGFSPRIVTHLATFAELKAFVQAGAGVTLLPEAAVRLELAGGALRALPLRGSVPAATLGAVWLPDGGTALVETVIDAAARVAQGVELDARP